MTSRDFSTVKCSHCGMDCKKKNSHIDRAKKISALLFCSKICFGLSKRVLKSQDQKKLEKAKYDAEYKIKNKAALKIKRAAYYKDNFDRKKEKEYRDKRMHLHVEYCRQPEYKAVKKEYDRKKVLDQYGIFSECAELLEQLVKELTKQATKYERLVQRGYFKRSAIERRKNLCQISSMNLTLPN